MTSKKIDKDLIMRDFEYTFGKFITGTYEDYEWGVEEQEPDMSDSHGSFGGSYELDEKVSIDTIGALDTGDNDSIFVPIDASGGDNDNIFVPIEDGSSSASSSNDNIFEPIDASASKSSDDTNIFEPIEGGTEETLPDISGVLNSIKRSLLF